MHLLTVTEYFRDDKTEIVSEAITKLTNIENKHWKRIADELQDCDPDQFLRAYSAGVESWIVGLQLI